MPGSVVSRLRLRVPPGHAARARARVEDALRLAAPDDRLLVVRRLDLGRMIVEAPTADWVARAAACVAEQQARAVHAAMPGASSADAVWFRSAEEAWALLLLELASGSPPRAWFWRPAVRQWDGAPLPQWLPRLVAQAARDPHRLVALSQAVTTIAAAGSLPAVSAALAVVPLPDLAGSPAPSIASGGAFPPPPPKPIRDARARAQAIFDRHLSVTRAAFVAAMSREQPGSAKVGWLARFALVAAAPELASQPVQLTELAAALGVSIGDRRSAEARAIAPVRPLVGSATIDPPPPPGPAAMPAPSVVVARSEPGLPPDRKEVRRAEADRLAGPAAATGVIPLGEEAASVAAGLFLLVRPLVMLGFPEWLDRHPAMAADGFAHALLRGIASRLRIGLEDPLFALLRPADPPLSADAITAWRVGLDRWLRRTAEIRLVDVVCRGGWISAAGEAVTIRFRVDSADIRLRRRALDIDPGWTPWLGWVMTYRYRDEPPA